MIAFICLEKLSNFYDIRTAGSPAKTNVFKLWSGVIAEKGVKGLWVGSIPTMYRAIVINCAQLASYSQFKELIADYMSNNKQFLL